MERTGLKKASFSCGNGICGVQETFGIRVIKEECEESERGTKTKEG